MSIQSILDHKGADVVTIRPDASIKSAADVMRHAKIAALVLKDDDVLVGLVSEREIIAAISELGQAALFLTVRSIARSVIAVSPRDSLKRAMSLMTRHRIRHLPVIDDGILVGLVSIGDIVKHRLEDLEIESNVLRDTYFARSGEGMSAWRST